MKVSLLPEVIPVAMLPEAGAMVPLAPGERVTVYVPPETTVPE